MDTGRIMHITSNSVVGMSTVSSICAHYGVNQEDLNKEISDLHLAKIVQSRCTRWRSLPSHLELETNLLSDIDRDFPKEVEKRSEFFDQWKRQKGSEATYKRLMQALLDVKERHDAEYVCQLSQQILPHSETSHDIALGK